MSNSHANQSLAISGLLLLTVGLVGPARLLAAETSAPAAPKDTPSEVEVDVPPFLQGSGYALYIDGEPINLNSHKTKLKPTLDPVRIELFSERHHLLWDGKHYVDAGVLEDLYARRFSVDFYLGSVQPTSPSQWRKLLLGGERMQFGADLNWLSEEGFGPFLTLSFQSSGKHVSEGVLASYASSNLGAGVFYDWPPWSRSKRYLRKISLQAEAGVVGNFRNVAWSDEVSQISDRTQDVSFLTGAGIKFPVGGQFSLKGRYRYLTEDAHFRRFDVRIQQGSHFFQFSGNYAF